jgi:membrane protein required for colicin V production
MKELSIVNFNWADFVMIFVIMLSLLIGLFRGFVREACSLVTWVMALYVAFMHSSSLSTFLQAWIKTPSLRTMITGALLFVVVLMAGAVVNHTISSFVSKTGLSGTNRLLGVVFGMLRGVLVVVVLLLLATLTAMPQDEWWSKSRLIPLFMPLVQWMQHFLPQKLAHLGGFLSQSWATPNTNSLVANVKVVASDLATGNKSSVR